MAILLPPQDPRFTLGGGIAQGISNFAQSFMDARQRGMEQQQQEQQRVQAAQGLMSIIPGIDAKQAYSLTFAPPQALAQYIKAQQQAPIDQARLQEAERAYGVGSAPQQGVPGMEQPMEPQQRMPQQASGMRPVAEIGQGLPPKEKAAAIEREIERDLKRQKLNQQQAQFESAHDLKTRESWARQAAPFLKETYGKANEAETLGGLAREALQVLQEGKPITGAASRLIPDYLRSEAGRTFQALANQIVSLKSQYGKGVASKQRIQLEREGKPNLDQPYGTIERILSDIIQEADKTLQKADNIDKIRELKGGIPKNLDVLSRKLNHYQNKLPDPNMYEPGSVIEDGGFGFINQEGEWQLVRAGE